MPDDLPMAINGVDALAVCCDRQRAAAVSPHILTLPPYLSCQDHFVPWTHLLQAHEGRRLGEALETDPEAALGLGTRDAPQHLPHIITCPVSGMCAWRVAGPLLRGRSSQHCLAPTHPPVLTSPSTYDQPRASITSPAPGWWPLARRDGQCPHGWRACGSRGCARSRWAT